MSLLAMATHIERGRSTKLIPYARNPRTHSDAQGAASIAAFGVGGLLLYDQNMNTLITAPTITSALGISYQAVPKASTAILVIVAAVASALTCGLGRPLQILRKSL